MMYFRVCALCSKLLQIAAGKITGLFLCSLNSHGREDSRSADLHEGHEDIQPTAVWQSPSITSSMLRSAIAPLYVSGSDELLNK